MEEVNEVKCKRANTNEKPGQLRSCTKLGSKQRGQSNERLLIHIVTFSNQSVNGQDVVCIILIYEVGWMQEMQGSRYLVEKASL